MKQNEMDGIGICENSNSTEYINTETNSIKIMTSCYTNFLGFNMGFEFYGSLTKVNISENLLYHLIGTNSK